MTGQSARRAWVEVGGVGRTLRVGIASGLEDFEQAFLLLAEKYRACGYEQAGTKLYRFTKFHALPGTITVVARDGGRVVATVSMVPDTALLGLPMDSVFGAELDRLRLQGRRLAEVTGLAGDGLARREFCPVLESMFSTALHHHLRAGGDTWLLAVHPRHAAFYRRAMGAQPMGVREAYPSVGGAPAEAFRIDLPSMEAHAPRTFARVVGNPPPESAPRAGDRPSDHVASFADRSLAADRRTLLEVARAVEATGGAPRWADPGSAPARRPAA